MPKTTTTTASTETANQPMAEGQTPEQLIKAVQDGEADQPEEEEAEEIAAIYSGNASNAFRNARKLQMEQKRNAVEHISQARQKFAEAADLAAKGQENSEEVAKISGEGAVLIYQAVSAGELPRDKVSEILGDCFGWKGKGKAKGQRITVANHPDAGATPWGPGEDVRKRIVRALKARDFVRSNGDEGDAFFEPLDPDNVRAALNAFESGEMSIDKLYKTLAEQKAEATGTRPPAAFDPKRILAMSAKMRENVKATAELAGKHPSLFDAYAELLETLELVGSLVQLPEAENDTETEEEGEQSSKAAAA